MKRRVVRAVRAAFGAFLVMIAPFGRADLLDNGDGTVTDTASGLMWLKNADTASAMDWAAAGAWVQGLNAASFAGHSDWRLPSGASPDGTVCNSAPSGANCTGTEFATLYFARTIMAYNPGPFVNLRAASYWTSTDLPGDPSQAMAQDFVDGGQNPFSKTSHLYAWAVRAAGPLPPETPQLYGLVSQGTNAGALIRIDTQNGAVSVVGPTGFESACGLTFDAIRSRLYLSPCWGQVGIQIVDRNSGAATPLGTIATGVRAIAHRPNDDRIYGMDPSPALLSLDTATGGSDLDVIGFIDKMSASGIAARPADGQLFGLGMTATGTQRLFKLKHLAGSGPRDVDVGDVAGSPIRALTFHSDGRLLATDGTKLVTIDPATGAVSSPIPFSGAAIGQVGALAVTGPTVAARPDVWIKDCKADDGAVPSAPTPCAEWRRSPDLMIDNDGNGVPDPVLYGRTNVVRITVRDRGTAAARGAVVRLYSVPGTTSGAPSLVGQRSVDVASGATAAVRILWPAPRAATPGSCLAVVLDHPSDRPNANPKPPLDNNKAVACFGKLPLAKP